MPKRLMRGGLFASMIIGELIKARFNRGLENNCWFWRDQTGHEVDCLLETAGELRPVEIKAGKTASPEFFARMQYWQTLSSVPAERSYAVHGGDDTLALARGNLLSWRKASSVIGKP